MAYWPERAPVWPRLRQRSGRLQDVFLGLIETERARLHLALLLTILFAGIAGFVVHPPRRLTVSADGQSVAVLTREPSVATVIAGLGFPAEPGDVILQDGPEIYLQRAVPVLVNVDGRVIAWRTRAASVGALLEEMQVELSTSDVVRLNGADVSLGDSVVNPPATGEALVPTLGVTRLEVRRAVPFTVLENGQRVTYRSAKGTVETALQDAGVRLRPADVVDPPLTSALISGMSVRVKHAKAVTILLGNDEHVIYTQRAQLRDALADTGLTLGVDDRVEPGLETAVADGLRARLVRVAGRDFTERDPVAKRTEFRPDAGLNGNSYRVVQGRDGVLARTFHVVVENGVEQEKQLIRESYERQMVPTVIYYPAGSAQPTGLPDGNINVTGVSRLYATWYNATSSGKLPGDDGYGVTKTGHTLQKGIVAVDPKLIPLGTRLYIPGYGFAVAADTGGGIRGNMIDLGYPDGMASDWRTGWVDVYILGN